MASKNNQQRNDEGKDINRTGTTLSDQGMKELLNNSQFQRKLLEHNAPSSSLQSSKENKQNKLSESSSTRSNSSDKKNKSSPTKTDRSNSVNRTSRREATLSTRGTKELPSSAKSKRKQLEHNAPSSESSNKAPKKTSRVQKVLSKFVNAVKHPTRAIKSSLGMNNDKKTNSHVDMLNSERSNAENRKPTRRL